jgi:hypothetical protein
MCWEIPVSVVTLMDAELRRDTDPNMEEGRKLCFAAEFASNLDTGVGGARRTGARH